MQDFRVKSGLRVNGNIVGANYITTGNITVTYTGLFKNINVTEDLVSDVLIANTVAVTGAISTEQGLISNNYVTFKDGSQIGDETEFNQLRIRAPLNYGVTIEPDADIAGNSLSFVFNTDGTFVPPGPVIGDLIGNVTGTVSSLDNFTTDDLKEGSSNLYYTDTRVINAVNPLLTTANVVELDNLFFSAQRTIEALAGNDITVNNLTVSGDLEIQGNTVTVNAATLTIEDKNIVIANGAVSYAQADGAGITIEGANATIIYTEPNDQLEFNKNLVALANLNVESTVDSFNTGTTGALTVAGGGYIAGNLIVDGDAYVGGDPVITLNPLNQSIALLRSQLEAAPGNVLYVAGNGNDANDGASLSNALANIHTALNRAQPWTTVFVKSGDYILYDQPVTMKRRVGLVGDNLRTTTIRPANTVCDMFYVNNACYATGITFRDHQSPAAVFSYNPDGSAGFITTSPYIQNCSSITTTGTGMRVDGRFVSGLRSMVCDSYTQTNAGGIGIHMLNRGYTQLVSVFTICCDIAILCENGGFCSITNSNSSFGNYGLVSRGVSEPLNRGTLDHIEDDGFETYYHMKNLDRRPNYGDAIIFANYNQDKCARDTGLIVDSLAMDLAYQSNTQSAFAGLQYWAQLESAIPGQATETIAAFNYAKDLATNVALNVTITSPRQANVLQTSGTAGGWVSLVADGFDLVANIITSGTFGITDRIIPNGFPANTNVAINDAANLIIANKEFIQKEVIAYVNQEYSGFFANANNFIDAANAETKCERDTGYLIDSIVFDFLHGGNRQAITSGVYYYNNDYNTSQITNQRPQTTAAYDFIGTIIDKIIKNKKIGPYDQEKCLRDTGLIVDSLLIDLAYGSNSQATFSGLQYWSQTESAIPNQSEETIAAIQLAKRLASNVIAGTTITPTYQDNVTQVSGTVGTQLSRVDDEFDLILDIIANGTVGVTDRIVSNQYPANADSSAHDTANLLVLNKEFIAAEVIAYINQTYDGFFANANNFLAPDTAANTCSRDVGYILESIAFDIRHDGNRQAIQSGVYYYTYNANVTQINDQIVQTGLAYDYIGRVIQDVVRNNVYASVYQTDVSQNTDAYAAATSEEANIVLTDIALIKSIITNGPTAAPAKTPIYYNTDATANVSNAAKIILVNKDFIKAETIAFVNETLFDPPYQDVVSQNTAAAPAATIAEANVVINNINLITDIISTGASAAPVKRPISYSTLSNDPNVINATKTILANRDYIVAEVTGYINQNWANISNGTVAFYSVANATPLVANTSIVRLLETINDITFLPNIAVTFHQPSYISGSSHTFEYVGSGEDLLQALPYNGGVPIQENEVVEVGGGLVYFTSTDQQGDFRIGNNLLFNRVDGTITGETFNKSLFAVMTPYILAIEG